MRLSAEQRDAARTDGAVRVVAGPGTGKTAVITERFRRLVTRGTSPSAILVMTFTERAAAEMRSRIVDAIGAEPPHVGTFHSLAMRWLREDGRAVGIHPAFSIEAGADRRIAVRELMWEIGNPALVGEERPDALVAPLLKMLERLKQELISLERLAAWCGSTADRERAELLGAAVELFREHERRKRRRNVLDFDDVLVSAVRLLAGNPALRDRYRERFREVMVDEYQDTNLAQERLVELLGTGGATFVVGDDDQSIYRFRGASLASMERFLRVFPTATTVRLGRNRRSTRAIVAASSALISQNADRIPKDLAGVGAAGEAVTILECADADDEAAAIGREIQCRLGQGEDASAIAVLCRTNAVARPIAEALRARALPVRHWGAQGLYSLPSVRDAIAMLRVLADPNDVVALARLLQRLGGGVVEGVDRIAAAARDRTALATLAGWRPAAAWAPALAEVAGLTSTLGAGDLFFELMSQSRYLERPDVDPAGVAAVTRFGELIADFCDRSPDQSLGAFLHRLDLVLLSGEDEEVPVPEVTGGEEPAVQVMTIHQAKGLEFDTVFVPALVEGRLPQPHRAETLDLPEGVVEPAARGREDHVAEERRLAYVAMTRARRRLFLSWALRYEGPRPWRPSRFIAEVESSGRTQRRVVAPIAASEAIAGKARDEAPRAAAGVTLSFSGIAAYRECPRQHWFRYRVGLPAAETIEAQYGTVLHAVLMRAGAERERGGEVDPALVVRLLDEEWSRVSFVDPRRAPTLRALAERQLTAYVDGGGLASAPHMVERSFTADLDGWRLRGIIDRVDGFPPPTLTGGVVGSSTPERWKLVDYKTGSPLPASRLRRDLQLALYALGAREALGIGADGTPVDLEIVYLKAGRTVTVPATDQLLDDARRAGTEVAAGVAAGRFEPRPERRRCGLCAYRLACSEAL